MFVRSVFIAVYFVILGQSFLLNWDMNMSNSKVNICLSLLEILTTIVRENHSDTIGELWLSTEQYILLLYV